MCHCRKKRLACPNADSNTLNYLIISFLIMLFGSSCRKLTRTENVKSIYELKCFYANLVYKLILFNWIGTRVMKITHDVALNFHAIFIPLNQLFGAILHFGFWIADLRKA